ncbi:MAG: HD domain-containing phosphohydrolase [Sporichthyaceae bacterium]
MGDDERTTGGSTRWLRRSSGATALRAAVLFGPVLTSFAAAYTAHRLMPPVTGHVDSAWHLAVLLVVSTVSLVLVDRMGRRLLPLVTLLDLSMLFPDRAPSRLKVAREAIRRRPIEEQLARVRDAGADPGAVAREILTLVAALSAHDKPTRGHAERVRMFTDLLAEQLNVPARDRDLLRWAAILHDIGKLQVPATLLNKPGKPTEDEWAVLRAHPSHGAKMAEGLLPWLGEWADVILQHHERYDGTGYPTGLAGSRISLGARIVSVADAYDVMTAARAYKRPVSRAAALQELIRFSGTQFDPQVVRAMVAVGAPRLRRAQGVVAWLADVPLVAGAVPASTLARVVGAGALATGAVASGGAVMALPSSVPTAHAATSIVSTAPTDGASPAAPAADRSSGTAGDRGAAGLPGAGPTTPSAPSPTGASDGPGSEPAAGGTNPGDGAGAGPATTPTKGTGPSPTTSPPPSSTGTPTKDPTPTVVATATGAVEKVTGTVTGTVGTVTGTVGGVVADPVGTVTGTVDGAVSDPVGTVTGTVGTVTGTVGGVVGGLTGSGTPTPTPTKRACSAVCSVTDGGS